MNIVVSGYYGSKNGGDEAMLAAMLEVLHDEDENLEVTVISMNPEYTKERHCVEAVGRLDFFAIAEKIRHADLLISGGGSLLQNVTSRRSLYYYLAIIFLAEILGCKVMLYAQGIGPIRGTIAHKLMNFIINRVDLITVRDKGSLEELKRLEITRPKIFCTADPVLAIKPASPEKGKVIWKRYLPEKTAGNFVGVSVRHWTGWEHCSRELATALNRLVKEKDATIIFLPMQFPEDIRAAKSVAKIMEVPAIVLDDEYRTEEILSLVGNMNLLISIRLHALIFAGVSGIPSVGISYDPKIERFLDSVGEKPVGNFDNVTAEEIFAAAVKKLENRKNSGDDSLFKNLRTLAKKNAELAIELIKGDGGL